MIPPASLTLASLTPASLPLDSITLDSLPRHEDMSSADAAWLHMDKPVNPMVICSLVELDRVVSDQRLQAVIEQRLVIPHPKFAMKVSERALPLRGPEWELDSDFRVSKHIHRLSPPPPHDRKALAELVGDLVSQPLPHHRPLWQMHLIDVNGHTVILVKMHHCIADGIALAQVLLSLTDEVPDAPARPPAGAHASTPAGAHASAPAPAPAHTRARPPAPAPAHAPARIDTPFRNPTPTHAPSLNPLPSHAARRLVHQGIESALHPKSLLHLARSGVQDAQTLAKLMLLPADPTGEGALKGPLSGARAVGWCDPLQLQLVKQIAHSHNATVNDVMLSAVSGAFRAHMLKQSREPGRMRAIVPFNLRPLDQPLPPSLGNRFGLVFLDLPVDVGDRRRRLAIVKERMDAIKDSPEGPVSYGVLQAVGLAPQQVESTFVDLFSSKGSAVVTNVPGPQRPRSLADATVRSIQIWAPTSGSVGISVSIISYNGEITVGLLADSELLSHPQSVAHRVGVEVEALARLSPRTSVGGTGAGGTSVGGTSVGGRGGALAS